MKAIAVLAGACMLSAVSFGEEIFTDDFSGANDAVWKSDSTNFTYSATEGENASRALVWESPELSKSPATLSYEFPVKFAHEYSYRIRAKATRDVVGRIWVRVVCRTKDGKLAFRLDGRPVINNSWKARRKGFRTINGMTPPIPAGAETCVLEIHVMRPTVGRVVFDDLEISCDGKTIIGYLQSSAYRDEATGGKVGFAAYYMYDPALCPVKDRRAYFTYRSRSGSVKRVPADTLAEDHILAKLDVGTYRLVSGEIAPGTEWVLNVHDAVGRMKGAKLLVTATSVDLVVPVKGLVLHVL